MLDDSRILPGSHPVHLNVSIQGAATMSKPSGGNVTDRESNPRPLGASSGDSTTHLKRSAVMSGTRIHRLIYRDIYVCSAARCTRPAAHNTDTELLSSLSTLAQFYKFNGGRGRPSSSRRRADQDQDQGQGWRWSKVRRRWERNRGPQSQPQRSHSLQCHQHRFRAHELTGRTNPFPKACSPTSHTHTPRH